MAKVCILLIAVALVAGVAACDGGPTGIRIHDWHDLDAIRDNLGGSYIVMNDLDSTTAGYEELASPTANEGKGWQPIGAFNATFTGTFDGQGHEICDLFIDRPEEVPVGLFGYVDERGVIKNLGVVNADVTGCIGVGGLVAASCGTVSNSYFTGSVTGNEDVGGLVGLFEYGIVSHSFWDTETSGQPTGWLDAGTGKNTTEMMDIATFSGAGWNITAVALGSTNTTYIWNIVNGVTYPFLSWQA